MRPGTSAATAGLRSGDRLVTVNEVFVVFLPVSEVMSALNMDQLVACVEFERYKYDVTSVIKKSSP